LAKLPALLRQQRRARQMSRAIEAASSCGVLRFLQVLLVCLSAVSEVLANCSASLGPLLASDCDWSPEERDFALSSDEFKTMLRGLATLRRLLWRLGLAAELFLPGGGIEGIVEGADLPPKEADSLKDLLERISLGLDGARAAWAAVEAGLRGLHVDLGAWEPGDCFEAGGCCSAAGGAAGGNSAAPLCVLCLLPARPPFSLEGEGSTYDGGVTSALWKGGLWHVQCANFWIRHGAKSKTLSDLGLSDPFHD